MTRETKTTTRCDAPGCDAEWSFGHGDHRGDDPNRKPTVVQITLAMGAVEWKADLCFGHRDGLKRAIDNLMKDYRTT